MWCLEATKVFLGPEGPALLTRPVSCFNFLFIHSFTECGEACANDV